MKILKCLKPGFLQYEDLDKPQIKQGYSLLKVKRLGICGTDLHAFEGTQPFFSYPRILGHEIAAELVNPNGASGFDTGELVTFLPYENCGICVACRTGKSNCCQNIAVYGVHSDGGMTEYLLVRSDLLVHGGGLSTDEIALVEPLAIGAHGVGRANIRKDEYVLVIGAGPIGLGIIEFARIAGGIVIVADVNAQRLEFCEEKLGVKHTVNVKTENLSERLNAITSGDMATVVIDATGNLDAINNGFHYLAHGGRYVLVGLQKNEIIISHPEFHKREATLLSSRNATRKDFEHVIHSMKSGFVNPQTYITHRVSFNGLRDTFETFLDPASKVIKAMIDFEN